MQERIDPKRVVLGMMPRGCSKCLSIQHVWFPTKEDWEDWSCPHCPTEKTDEIPTSV